MHKSSFCLCFSLLGKTDSWRFTPPLCFISPIYYFQLKGHICVILLSAHFSTSPTCWGPKKLIAACMFHVYCLNKELLASLLRVSHFLENSALRFCLSLHFQVGVLALSSHWPPWWFLHWESPSSYILVQMSSCFLVLSEVELVPIILLLAGGQLCRKKGTQMSLLLHFKIRSLLAFIFKITFL